MKATMMKVSDPIIFGACVEVFYAPVFEKYGEEFAKLGVDITNGLGDVYAKIANSPLQAEIEAAIEEVYENKSLNMKLHSIISFINIKSSNYKCSLV